MARTLVNTDYGLINLEHVARFEFNEGTRGGSYTLHIVGSGANGGLSRVSVSEASSRASFEIIEDWVTARTIRQRPRMRLGEMDGDDERWSQD